MVKEIKSSKTIFVIGDGEITDNIFATFRDENNVWTDGMDIIKLSGIDNFFEVNKNKNVVVLIIPDELKEKKNEKSESLNKLLRDFYNRVIVVTRDYDMSFATSVVEKGAFDVIDAGDMDSLIRTLKVVCDAQEIKKGFIDIETMDSLELDVEEEVIVGKSRVMINLYKAIGFVAKSDVPVLIVGETGTGKELVARMIHKKSSNKEGPFVGVNCSAIPETLLESELFGAVKGAYTGSVQDRPGKIEAAENGTLFLDEIAEIPPSIQVKLLRVLQEKTFERLGENRFRRVEARVMAATNKNLEEEINAGKFREDLYYRLNLATISVPPLRERKEDIPLLVKYFLLRARNELHKKVKGITAKAVEKLMRYDWPGNVRELLNVVYRAVLIARGEYVMAEDVALDPTFRINQYEDIKLKTLQEMEKEYIQRVLNYTRYNKSKAAKLLGISRPALIQKIKRYGIK